MKTRYIKYIILFIATFGIQTMVRACSCHHYYVEHFCSIVNENHFIIRAVVIDNSDEPYIDPYRKIKVINNLNKGIAEDTVVLHGSSGVNCGEPLQKFLLGDTLILALEDYGQDVYYLEGSCGIHYLRYSSGRVFTNIYPTVDTMDYQIFVDELLQCMDFSTSLKEQEADNPPVRFYPNPFTDELSIESSVAMDDNTIFSIFSITGQLLRQEKFGSGTTKTLSVEDLPQGVYLLEVKNDRGERWTEKLVKQ